MSRYQITKTILQFTDAAADFTPYVLPVRDMDDHDKPREKLLRGDPSVLSLSELLAVIIGRGTRKEEVMAMSSRIFKEYGEKTIASERDAKRLSDDLSVPIIPSMQIVAAIELGRRLFDRKPGRQSIRTARDVYEYAKHMRDLPREHLRGIYLNSHYKIIHDEVISIGTIDATITHPREVFKPAIEYSAAAIILVHNHPSGALKPSRADAAITEQLAIAGKMLGIELIDHVIVSPKGFISMMHHQEK